MVIKLHFLWLLKEKKIYIILKTDTSHVKRTFKGFYNMHDCKYIIEKDSGFMSSPLLFNTNINCSFVLYSFQTTDSKRSITFLNAPNDQEILITGSGSQDSTYSGKAIPPEIIGKDEKTNLVLTISPKVNIKTVNFTYESLQKQSEFIKLSRNETSKDLSYNSSSAVSSFLLESQEIHWIIESENNTHISLKFTNLLLTKGAQILISDGNTKFSQPIRQLSSLDYNLNGTYMLSTGNFLRISLTPANGKITVNAQVRSHSLGGYYQKKGELSFSKSKEDIIYLLEVNEDENVVLNSKEGNPLTNSSLYIYNDFSVNSKLLFVLKGNIPNFPIVSDTSKMMIVAKNFSDNTDFKTDFQGMTKGCYRMTTESSYDYVISGNCQKECIWIIPPNNTYDTISMHLHLLSFAVKDIVSIKLLDKTKTTMLDLRGDGNVPELYLPAKYGISLITKNVNCNVSDAFLHVNYEKLNGCEKVEKLLPGKKLTITSPNYPNTYPILADCWSNITSNNTGKNLFHVAFDRLSLSPIHCLKFWEDFKAKNSTVKTFSGETSPLPDDLLFQPDLAVEFISKACNTTKFDLNSALGFSLNVTSADCGGAIMAKTGNFSTPDYPNKTTSSYCTWLLEVPNSSDINHPNVINFTVKINGKDNSHLKIYDGGSVRDVIKEVSSKDMLSRTNKLIFVYDRSGLQPSDNLLVQFHSQTCNMTCQNKLCLHASWVCNGINECGDNTDELNCTGRPLPPVPPVSTPAPQPEEHKGVSPVALGLGLPIAFILGILAALFVPPLYRRFRSSQYHQFRDISAEA